MATNKARKTNQPQKSFKKKKSYDESRIHLVFTNEDIAKEKLSTLLAMQFGGEEFAAGSICLYMYLPREVSKKVLKNSFLDKKLGIVMKMYKIKVG